MADEAAAAETHLPRGVRNNNPGNLRPLAEGDWQGQTGVDADDFCIFGTAAYGFRALCLTLHTYYWVHKDVTVRQIITRYAPSSENDTDAYIKAVCELTKHDADEDLSWVEITPDIALAIAVHENGELYWDKKVISDGLALAEAH